MTDPTHRQADERGNFYLHPQTSERWPSITTVTKALAKPALTYWAAGEAATYAVEHPELWHPQTAADGTVTPALVDQERVELKDQRYGKWGSGKTLAKQLIKGACWDVSGAKADTGSIIHSLIENRILGTQLREMTASEKRYMAQFEDFEREFTPQWEAAEFTVVNRKLGYAGTGDALAVIPLPGLGLTVLDWKTSESAARNGRPYGEWALQLAALANGETILLDDGTEVEMPRVAAAASVVIRPKSVKLYPVTDLAAAWKAFQHLACVNYWWKWQMDDAFGPEVLAHAVDNSF